MDTGGKLWYFCPNTIVNFTCSLLSPTLSFPLPLQHICVPYLFLIGQSVERFMMTIMWNRDVIKLQHIIWCMWWALRVNCIEYSHQLPSPHLLPHSVDNFFLYVRLTIFLGEKYQYYGLWMNNKSNVSASEQYKKVCCCCIKHTRNKKVKKKRP